MILEFDIPRGHMRILVETFFENASMSQIRRMFKMLGKSGLDDNRRQEILVWLRDRATEAYQRAAAWQAGYIDFSTRHKELEEQYEHMNSPCYAEYTQDKEKLKAAKERVVSARRRASDYKCVYQKDKKEGDRYQKIIDILVEVIERGGGGCEGD